MSRNIAVLTVGRSDFGRYRPILRALRVYPNVGLRILATAGHFSLMHGETWREIEAAGFTFEPGLEATLSTDAPVGVGKTIALATSALAQSFARERPDLLVLLGDRYEMLSGANAAMGFNLPVVHIHGGAVTEGAIDELVRHALTKMSHYHLVSTEEYGRRVRQMGEEDWRVHVVGAPGLDELAGLATLDRAALCSETGLDLTAGFLLVSFHPVTLELPETKTHIETLLEVLKASSLPSIISYPNADPGGYVIIGAIEEYAKAYPGRAKVYANLGAERYTSFMAHASAMVGNSSSGLVEAPSFGLPVVNIGTRQDGKIKAGNVIDCGYGPREIALALKQALSPEFRLSLRGLRNPYGDGRSGERIAEILATLPITPQLLRKRFIDQ